MKKIIITLLAAWCIVPRSNAQVTCSPVFPGPDDNVTITFDPQAGDRGLSSWTGDVYAHTGVNKPWKYVNPPEWGGAAPTRKMTRQANGTYTIVMNTIRQFYAVPAAEKILTMNFVFNNGTGPNSQAGKGEGGDDIFYDVVQAGAPVKTKIVSPSSSSFLSNAGATINVKAAASQLSTLTMTDNGVAVSTANNATELNAAITVSGTGSHLVKFKAVSGAFSDSSSFIYVVVPAIQVANPPVGALLGSNINAAGDSVTLLFQAPSKQNVYVLGSFNNYQIDDKYLMKKSVDGKTWWVKIGVTPGQVYTYQYLVDGSIRVADPLSNLVLDPNNDKSIPAITYPNMPPYPSTLTTGIASVLQPGKAPYVWKTTNFVRPQKRDLVIYELLTRDFVLRHDFQTLIDTISYLKNLGINAIELMPVSEFDNNESWGYNPSFHMALDKYYGTQDKFKEFVDLCHSKGIAVILDVVYNHVSGNNPIAKLYLDGGKPASNSPFLNRDAPHPYSVDYDLNHTSEYTRNYVERCIEYWIKEYQVDGYRFDLVKGFTQNQSTEATAGNYDQSRVDIIKNYHQKVQAASAGAYTILEAFVAESEESVYANEGMMVWANAVNDYNEATMGYTNNRLAWGSGLTRGWTGAKHDSHLPYMESHDEERLMHKNITFGNASGNYSTKDIPTALKRIELASAFFYTIPGPRMLWQFGELGYDFSINFNGRVGNKPIKWDYFADPNRKRLYDVTRNIINLRNTNSAFKTLNYVSSDLNAGYSKAFHIQDANLSVTVLGNFNVIAAPVTPVFQSTGKWYNYITGDSITVTDVNAAINFLPGEYRIYTSKKLPVPPAGYFRYFTSSTPEFAALVNEFIIYPNPSVSGKTFVGYNLSQGGEVAWEVFNLMGQKMAQSLKKNLLAGSYQDELNAALPTGTYMIRLNVNGASATKKLFVD